jgi:TRAP-type C4-dicarboxylate transport system permease small subunit
LVFLEKLARLSALLGGVLLACITLVTCVSVAGRNLADLTLIGDFELTGAICGVAIALFLPWCQLSGGNIIVDFFTANARPHTIAQLDRAGAWLMALVMAVLAWRTGLGGANAWANHSASMLLGFPDWVVYAGMLPAMGLTGVIALGQATGRIGTPLVNAP